MRIPSAARLAALVSLFLCSLVPAQAQFTAVTRQAQLWRNLNEPPEFVVLKSKDRFICDPGVAWTRTRPLWIHGDVNDPPLAGLVLCRNSQGESVHGSRLSNIRFTGSFKVSPLIILCHEGIAIDNVIVDCSVPGKPAAGVAGIIFSSVDLWNLGVPAGFTCTGATITNTHAYNWQGGDSCAVLFVGEVTDIDWRGFQQTGIGQARVRTHAVPGYRWSNGLGDSTGVPKRINFSHCAMTEGTFAHAFVRTRDPLQPSYSQDVAFSGGAGFQPAIWQAHDIPPVVAPPGGNNGSGTPGDTTGGGTSGGGSSGPDTNPQPSPDWPASLPRPEWTQVGGADILSASGLSAFLASRPVNRTFSGGAFPYAAVAGDTIEIAAGTYPNSIGMGRLEFTARGTADNPVILKAVAHPPPVASSPVRLAQKLRLVNCDYVILAGFDADKIEIGDGTKHVIAADCRIGEGQKLEWNDITKSPQLVQRKGGGLALNAPDSSPLSQIVVIRCTLERNGDFALGESNEIHGATVNGASSYVAFIDCRFSDNNGDGCQVNGDRMTYLPDGTPQCRLHHIFFYNCFASGNRQVGIAFKQVADAIVSRCTATLHVPVGASPSAWGAGIGMQYGGHNIWIDRCPLDGNVSGISGGSSNGPGGSWHFVGCHIHDNNRTWPGSADVPSAPTGTGWAAAGEGKVTHPSLQLPDNSWGPAGIVTPGSPDISIVQCTIEHCDAGINLPGGNKVLIAGNRISGIKQAEGNAIYIADPQYLTSLRVFGNAFGGSGGSGGTGLQPVMFKRGNARSTFDAWISAFGAVATAAGNVIGGTGLQPVSGGAGLQPTSWTPPSDLPDVYAKFERLYPGASIRFDINGKPLPTTGPRQIGAFQP